ncbi:MAG TPA: hypothetical protein ENL43_00490 [candidate division WOR-3 bacterium]|uniref:Uncharacterized protein n=1 Tax=candidate division WOR-3 bacterium TaxID=2052148 RepID=A0A7V5HM52_UNCW3|nr:hypothetical protein [candidate division WOR-3 bacterium]
MEGLSYEDILALWESVTDFSESWHEKIEEMLFRIDEMRVAEDFQNVKDKLDELQKKIMDLRMEIEDAVEKAHHGDISLEDLEGLFRDYGDELMMLEQELIELELEPDIYEDYYYEEEEEEF